MQRIERMHRIRAVKRRGSQPPRQSRFSFSSLCFFWLFDFAAHESSWNNPLNPLDPKYPFARRRRYETDASQLQPKNIERSQP